MSKIKVNKKLGRPVKPLKEKHSKCICLKLKPEQYNDILKNAKKLHTTPATYVRNFLFSEVRKQLSLS